MSEIETERQTVSEIERQRDRETDSVRNRETERQTVSEIERQRDRETDSVRNRGTERQRDRQCQK